MASSQLEQKQKTPLMDFFCCYLPFREHTYLCTETQKSCCTGLFRQPGSLLMAGSFLIIYYLEIFL